jgi:biopolymer transport protein ExbD
MMNTLDSVGNHYGITFTEKEKEKFKLEPTFGIPIKSMKAYLALKVDEQDKVLANYGIPTDSLNNEFKAWIQKAKKVNPDLRIAIKADQKTPYKVIKDVMTSLQDLRENRYNLITALKNETAK